MANYTHRRSGKQVTAVRYTSPASGIKVAQELGVSDYIDFENGLICLNGVMIKRGQYAAQTMFAIVAVDQDVFDRNFSLDEIQGELF